MQSKVKRITFLSLAAGLLLLAGCQDKAEPTSKESHKEVQTDAKDTKKVKSLSAKDQIHLKVNKNENVERLKEFVQHIEEKIEDRILLVNYTIEGDPIKWTLTYKEDQIHITYDSTKDQFGKGGIVEATARTIYAVEDYNKYAFRAVDVVQVSASNEDVKTVNLVDIAEIPSDNFAEPIETRLKQVFLGLQPVENDTNEEGVVSNIAPNMQLGYQETYRVLPANASSWSIAHQSAEKLDQTDLPFPLGKAMYLTINAYFPIDRVEVVNKTANQMAELQLMNPVLTLPETPGEYSYQIKLFSAENFVQYDFKVSVE